MSKAAKVVAAPLLLALCQVAHAQALQCTDIARTLKEFSISTSSTSYLNSVFDNYCEASGNTRQTNSGVGLDAVVKAIPIRFSGSHSSSEEAMKNFCKTYSSSSSLQDRKYSYEEKIAGKALDTVSDCLRLQSQGVTITHDVVNREKMAFFLKSGIDQKISLSGVSISGSVSCSGLVNGQPKTINESTGIPVSKSQNFTCTRSPISGANQKVKLYEEAAIVVSTNFGNYNVLWPRDERLPEDMATAIAIEVDSVRKSANSNSASIASIVGAKTVPVYRCPSGTAGWHPTGSWGSYGCQGQLSTEATCTNIEYPHQQPRSCDPIGVVRLY